jgi:Prp8 binding protein
MSAEKRAASDTFGSSQMLVKRPNLGNGRAVTVTSGSAANGALITSVPRTSGLQAPVMELTGHSGEVFVARFNPEGNYIASGSMDRSISKYSAPPDGPGSLTDC